MQKKSRMIALGAMAIAGSLSLTGCLGGGGAAPKGDDGETVLRIASAETADSAIKAMQEAGDRYEEETGVKVIVEAVPLTDIYTKVNSVYGTRAAYSAFATGFHGHVQLLQAEDKVVPVDDIIDRLGGEEDFYDGHILFPIDDKDYWLPFDYNLAYGIIRTDWLEQVGMEIPTTQEELLDVAKAFDELSPNTSGVMMPLKADDSANWITSQVLWAQGVRIFDDNWEVIVDEGDMAEKTTAGLEYLKELHQYMPDRADNATYGDMLETFIGEQVGITFYTGRMFDNIIAQNPELIDNVAIFGMPMADGDGVTAGLGYDGFSVLKTEHTDETLKFMEWYFENELINLYASSPLHYQPAQRSFWEREDWKKLPAIEKYGERLMDPLVEFIDNADMHSIDSDGPYADFRAGQVFQSMVFPQAYQKATFGGESPEEITTWLGDAVRDAIK